MNIKKYINSLSRSCFALFTAVIFFVFSIVLIGCEGFTDAMQSGPADPQEQNEEIVAEDQDQVETEEELEDTSSDIEEETRKTEEQADIVVKENTEEEAETTDQEESPDEITIRVYFADEMGEYLVGETRTIPYQHRYSNALVELMKLPVDESLIPIIPETARVNSFNIEDGTAHIDFSEEFVNNRFISDTADILLVYSIVNTLTEFPEINSVIFYINGVRLDILGMLDLSDPIYRKNDLIIK